MPTPSSSVPSRWEIMGHTLLAHTPIFDVRSTRYRHPLRKRERQFVVIDAPDWVNVVAVTPDQRIVLIRQFRYGTDELSLEIPGGVIEKGEEPMAAGIRELQEETGYTGAPARLLGSVHPNPAIQGNRCHYVLVEQATLTHPHSWDPDEEIQTTTLPAEEVFTLARTGGITHGLVLNALLLFEGVWRARNK